MMTLRSRLSPVLAVGALSAVLAGCHSSGELVVDEGVGISAVRGACPAVGVPDYTGDVTLFRQAASTDSRDIDVVANLTELHGQCDDKPGKSSITVADDGKDEPQAEQTPGIKLFGMRIAMPGLAGFKSDHKGKKRKVTRLSGQVASSAGFVVQARRTDPHGARDVTLPYFVTVLRGGTAVVAKRVGQVTVHFADGQLRAQALGGGTALIDRAEATLDRDIHDRITKKRKAGEADAAVDPLADPEVKAAVNRATFELLVGFQLDDKQLAYNATR